MAESASSTAGSDRASSTAGSDRTNLQAQVAALAKLERRASNGGMAYDDLRIPSGCVELVINRESLTTPLGMRLRSGGQHFQPFIEELDQGGPAQKSGLCEGDVIVSANDEEAKGANQVARILKENLKIRLIVRKAKQAGGASEPGELP